MYPAHGELLHSRHTSRPRPLLGENSAGTKLEKLVSPSLKESCCFTFYEFLYFLSEQK